MVYMVFVFFIMSILLFLLYTGMPGDPARAEVEPLKRTLTPEAFEDAYREARARYGMDDPIVTRYTRWMGRTLRGDFGDSLVYKRPVFELVKPPIGTTVKINLVSTFLVLGVTIPLGIRQAVRKNTLFDRSVQATSIVGYSIPTFILALILIYLFSVRLQWLPISGLSTPNFTGTPWEEFWDQAKHLVLIILVILLTNVAFMSRYVRAAMIDSLSMDYIKTARAKGVKEKAVVYRHAWRNALLPVITLIMSWFIGIFGGSVVLETMFGINGMGKFYIDALNAKDFNVALAVQMFYIVISLIGTLLIDLSYGLVDPRVRINE